MSVDTSDEPSADASLSAASADLAPPSRRDGRFSRRLPRLRGLRLVAAMWLTVIVVACLLAPLLPLPDPEVGSGAIAGTPGPGRLLGTDQLARDILSRILWGGRTSVLVAASATLLAMTLGLTIGIIAGYFRGKLDTFIAGAADFVLAFPALILLIVLTSVLGLSVRNLILGLFVLGTPTFVRISRAHALTVSQREFVLAAKGSGASHFRIMRRHILPLVLRPVSAYALTYAAVVFVAEGSLSFLGLGVPPPTPSWGSMIAGGRPWLDRAAHIIYIPSLVLIATVLALNYLGDRPGKGRSR